MLNIITWLTIINTFILMIGGIIGIIQLVKYWKKPKVELDIDYPHGKLTKVGGNKFVEFNRIPIRLINSGNEDVFIRNFIIGHEGLSGGNSYMPIARDFNLPSRSAKSYEVAYTPNYTPKENKNFGGKWDNFYVEVTYGKNKKVFEKLYYIISEKTKTISTFYKESIWKNRKK